VIRRACDGLDTVAAHERQLHQRISSEHSFGAKRGMERVNLRDEEPKFDVVTDGFPVETDVARGDDEGTLERDDRPLKTARDG
jgi:hypothetical protein